MSQIWDNPKFRVLHIWEVRGTCSRCCTSIGREGEVLLGVCSFGSVLLGARRVRAPLGLWAGGAAPLLALPLGRSRGRGATPPLRYASRGVSPLSPARRSSRRSCPLSLLPVAAFCGRVFGLSAACVVGRALLSPRLLRPFGSFVLFGGGRVHAPAVGAVAPTPPRVVRRCRCYPSPALGSLIIPWACPLSRGFRGISSRLRYAPPRVIPRPLDIDPRPWFLNRAENGRKEGQGK